MRLFIGIPLTEPVTDEISRVSTRLKSQAKNLRWSVQDSWHITLQFLGNAGEEQYECLAVRLRELSFSPVPVRVESLGVFDRAGILFAEIARTPELAALQQRVTLATSQCGFKAEDRPYHPHVTLARTKGKDGRRELRKVEAEIRGKKRFGGFVAAEFVLYESRLGSEGSRYLARQRFVLK